MIHIPQESFELLRGEKYQSVDCSANPPTVQEIVSEPPVISVLMLVYNHERFLAEALESIIFQQCSYSFEIVIGEDASSDRSLSILKEYRQKFPEKIRIVSGEKNIGAIGNFFRTLSFCRGKYLAFCEGDDYWKRTDKLQLQVNFLETHLDCSAAFTSAERYFQSSGKTESVISIDTTEGFWNFSDILFDYRGWPASCTLFCRRELMIRFQQEIPWSTWNLALGDAAWRLALASYGRIACLPEVTGVYRTNAGSATKSGLPERIVRLVADSWFIRNSYALQHGNEAQQRELALDLLSMLASASSGTICPARVAELFRLGHIFGKHWTWREYIRLQSSRHMGSLRLLRWTLNCFKMVKQNRN
jgi:Glycosyltransferases involved in cell wall biogenesis